MNKRSPLSLSGWLFVAGLVAAAGLIELGRWRWALVVSLILTLFIFVMGFIAPGLFADSPLTRTTRTRAGIRLLESRAQAFPPRS